MNTEVMFSRKCSKCKRVLSLDFFYNKKGGKYGKSNYCKICEKIISNKNALKNPIRLKATYLLSDMKKRSVKRNYCLPEFSIEEITNIITNGSCCKTGIKFSFDKLKKQNPYSPSPDRIDNSKGYTKDNVQWVVWIYNKIKGDFDEEEFLNFIKVIYKITIKNNE